jgi:hypothetical protein
MTPPEGGGRRALSVSSVLLLVFTRWYDAVVQIMLRFIWVTILTACAVAFLVRYLADEPARDPSIVTRGVLIWGVAALVAAVDAVRVFQRIKPN